ncbi:hypothetical protein ILUMI_15148 [Ignelater luminosus]|uniref:PiggyBac transposable element-derived protein domain-containing protein n=1 Tax=Ignelater luminosus TaxID=2038154 RepID=A0A8K0CX56_IGNLU|nr:hypothetical protein ILUMI_15148 [Ignelater luminosus]
MLVPVRSRCSFKMYLPKKPCKYGIKVMCMCDSRTHYLCNALVYTGKGERVNNNLSVPTNDLLKLIPPIERTNRNIVVDNWFTSIELCEKLREKKLTVLGTLRMNKPQIPLEFKPNRKRAVRSIVFGHANGITICSYVPEKNRAVVVIYNA